MIHKETLEYTEDGELSIVRTNMMQDPNYTGYCGNSWNEQRRLNCDMPRTKWIPELSQFKCPKCGWVSEFPESFIKRYKEKHNK